MWLLYKKSIVLIILATTFLAGWSRLIRTKHQLAPVPWQSFWGDILVVLNVVPSWESWGWNSKIGVVQNFLYTSGFLIPSPLQVLVKYSISWCCSRGVSSNKLTHWNHNLFHQVVLCCLIISHSNSFCHVCLWMLSNQSFHMALLGLRAAILSTSVSSSWTGWTSPVSSSSPSTYSSPCLRQKPTWGIILYRWLD